jgi:murein DD-endopeptidase MepM/ murein hydrolase activator NlpD
MIKVYCIISILFTSFLIASKSIDKEILSNENMIKKNINKKELTSIKLKILSTKINKENIFLRNLDKDIHKISIDINKHKIILLKSKKNLTKMNKESILILNQKNSYEKKIIDILITNFSSSIALRLANKKDLKELFDSEIYELLSISSKKEIDKLSIKYKNIKINRLNNKRNIEKENKYIKIRNNQKKKIKNLKEKRLKTKKSLENIHLSYQKELKNIIIKQKRLSKLLTKLKIIKDRDIKKSRLIKKKYISKKSTIDKKIDISNLDSSKIITNKYTKILNKDIRIIGSSTKGIKISKYRGSKTISPLKSYNIIKKFGKYYDPIYKIKLFNESIVLKSKKKLAKVYNILNGKIVYAKKDTNMLENVVIVSHNNGLHTIYSHLDKISPNLKIGKWIKKGYVIGKIKEKLTFQATKNSYHINPLDLF